MYGIVNFSCLRHLGSKNFVLKFILKHFHKENKLKSDLCSVQMGSVRPFLLYHYFYVSLYAYMCVWTCVACERKLA